MIQLKYFILFSNLLFLVPGINFRLFAVYVKTFPLLKKSSNAFLWADILILHFFILYT